ncbi:MAG: hypothetical protein LBT75_02570 [Bacilli bacterium]|jgi:aspartyl/glutamyl-tRNA(Asn/Gln) amidotransferase C subunit|nr:hypothetical protein [Bacilli bacterium]
MINFDIDVLLDDLYLSSEGNELAFIKSEFAMIAKAIAYFDDVNVEGIKTSTWPFLIYNNYLREDEITHTMKQDDAFANAQQTQDNYVKYVKVV